MGGHDPTPKYWAIVGIFSSDYGHRRSKRRQVSFAPKSGNIAIVILRFG
jgi:hypothetical protein